MRRMRAGFDHRTQNHPLQPLPRVEGLLYLGTAQAEEAIDLAIGQVIHRDVFIQPFFRDAHRYRSFLESPFLGSRVVFAPYHGEFIGPAG